MGDGNRADDKEEVSMFEPVKKLARHHKTAIQDAYREGYHAAVHVPNPYAQGVQAGKHHAWNAGRYDKTRGFAFEELEVPAPKGDAA